MKKNFVIDNVIAIKSNNLYLDIHNCYYFQGLNIRIPQNDIVLTWKKLEREWISVNDPLFITLACKNILFFEMSETFYETHPIKLQEIGYKDPLDFDYDWINWENQSEENYHIIFRFENDEYLRVYCEEIKFST